jgi:hypothetical protein
MWSFKKAPPIPDEASAQGMFEMMRRQYPVYKSTSGVCPKCGEEGTKDRHIFNKKEFLLTIMGISGGSRILS